MSDYPLKDLAEYWEYEGEQAGIHFHCPNCGALGGVNFEGTKYAKVTSNATWKKTGDTLETMSLTPSVLLVGHFHSWIRNGALCVDSDFSCVREP